MSTVDLRCEGTLHGRLIDDRYLEVKCNRRICGYRKGLVILHTIDLKTNQVTHTKVYAEPKKPKEHNNDSGTRPAVRSA